MSNECIESQFVSKDIFETQADLNRRHINPEPWERFELTPVWPFIYWLAQTSAIHRVTPCRYNLRRWRAFTIDFSLYDDQGYKFLVRLKRLLTEETPYLIVMPMEDNRFTLQFELTKGMGYRRHINVYGFDRVIQKLTRI